MSKRSRYNKGGWLPVQGYAWVNTSEIEDTILDMQQILDWINRVNSRNGNINWISKEDGSDFI